MAVILVFDLDGTIAPYKRSVSKKMAEFLNKLARSYEVRVVTGGKSSYAKRACRRLENIYVVGTADRHSSIDMAKALGVSKSTFHDSKKLQKSRLSIIKQLNYSLYKLNLVAMAGGRSTIDITHKNSTKANMVHGDIIYFYDCKWEFNLKHSNDWPLIKKSTKAIRTDWKRIRKDVIKCLQ